MVGGRHIESAKKVILTHINERNEFHMFPTPYLVKSPKW